MAVPYRERLRVEAEAAEERDLAEDTRVAAGNDGGSEAPDVETADNERPMFEDNNIWSSDVFVSHSSNQMDVARELKRKLSHRGFKVFIYEDDVPAGSSIPHAISNAIYKCRRCVMIISRDFLESHYFVSEYRWAVDHQNRRRIITCLPVLYQLQVGDLPAEIRNISCLHYSDPEFYGKLERAIQNDIPIESQIKVTQTGVGLAWSYFYGYLNIILPGLEQRVNECTKFKVPVYPKIVVILPVSCRCPDVMPEEENFRHVGYIEYKVSRAANRERCYKSSVYDFAFTSSRDKAMQVHCHLIMEFATPLLSLFQMHEGNIAQLDKGQMTNERHTFKEVVSQILNYESMKNCRGKYLLIDYRDEDEQTTSHKWTKETLSEVVAREVENDMIAHNCDQLYLFPVESVPATAESVPAKTESIFQRLLNRLRCLWLILTERR